MLTDDIMKCLDSEVRDWSRQEANKHASRQPGRWVQVRWLAACKHCSLCVRCCSVSIAANFLASICMSCSHRCCSLLCVVAVCRS